MKKMLYRTIAISLFALVVSGCASNKKAQLSTDSELHQLVEKFRAGNAEVTYNKLWDAYLASSQTQNTSIQNDVFLDKKKQLESGAIDCRQIDWEALIKQNYWNIPPHLTAADCYSKMGNQPAAEFHENFVATILRGVFESGTGKHFYDAFEAASWGDVDDLMELAGYKSIDQFLELKGSSQGVYYVVVAEDLQTGIQQDIYFDNIRFINSALGYIGRLGDSKQPLGLTLVKELANNNKSVAITLGDMLSADKEYELAAEWYVKATIFDSPVAYLKAARLCLSKKLPTYSDGTCLEFVTKAAELEYANAYVLLSALYKEGIWVAKDEGLASDFLQAAIRKKSEGEVYGLLADFYYSDLFGKENRTKAFEYYQRARNKGVIEPEYVNYLRGDAFSDDKNSIKSQSAINELVELATQGSEIAQTIVGAKYLFEGIEDKKSDKESLGIDYITRAAEQRYPYAQFLLGSAYKHGYGVAKNDDKAHRWFFKAANSWDSKAQFEVASYLHQQAENLRDFKFKILKDFKVSGLKIKFDTSDFERLNQVAAEKSDQAAFDWMNSAARQGNLTAVNALGYYFENGIGVAKNAQSAFSFYKLGFEKKHQYASYNYANMLRYGHGVDVDYPQALLGYQQAQTQGHIASANELGLMYEQGLGVEINFAEAFKYFRLAAEAGYRWAQFNLGRCYEKGVGVEVNLQTAITWYQKAANQGHDESRKRAVELGGKLSTVG